MDIFRLVGKIAIESDAAIKGIQAAVNEAENAESKMASKFKSIGQKSVEMGKKMAAASAAATGGLVGMVKSSASVAAEVSAYEQIMGSYADTASKKLAGVADAVGMADTRLTPYMTSMTAKFQGLGLGIEQSTDLASSGLTIAADAAAFWDKSLEDSMSALNSFVNGNYEGGESIGLFANETTLARYAAEELGLEWQNLTEAEKQIARLSFAEEMQESSKVTGQAAKESGQYANVMAELGNSVRQLAASLGETLLPIVTKVVQWLTNVTEKLEGMNKGVKVVVVALVALVAAAAPMLIAFGMVATGISSMIGLFGTLKALLPIVKTAFTGLNTVMMANPIGLVIAAIAALVAAFVLLWKKSEGFRKFWINLWENIKEKVSKTKENIVSAFNNLKTNLSNAFNAIKTKATSIWNGIKDAITNPIKTARNTIEKIIDKIKGFFPLKIGKIFSNLKVPKIDISGGKMPFGIGGLGEKPTIDVKWNAVGAVFKKPTIFNTTQGLQGVGEAGAEAVAPIDTLQQYVASAVASQNEGVIYALQNILNAIQSLDGNMGDNMRYALNGTAFELNRREFGRLVKEVR